MNENIKTLTEKLQAIKDELLQAILSDESQTKLDRLQLINSNNLFKTEAYLQRPLKEKYLEQLKELVKVKGRDYVIDENWPIIDADYFNRGQRVSIAEQLLYTFESLEDEGYEDGITIISDRYTGEEIKISYEQLESEIYEWCVKNKTIAFHFDW
jgi:hypothetical protein